MNTGFSAKPLAEDALLLRFGEHIDATVNARVLASASQLRAAKLPGVFDIVPTYATLLLRVDLAAFDDPRTAHARLLEAVRVTLHEPTCAAAAGHEIEIPVCYDGAHGADLEDVARHAALDVRQVIARHAAAEYTVAMLGFAPGFPYLLGLDRALHTPRRATPRTRVPAGSIAIGGAQTGIYPCELPGGWMLIGRTPLTLFDAARNPPCLLEPGDRVRFRAIDAGEFDTLLEKRGQGTLGRGRQLRPLLDSREQG